MRYKDVMVVRVTNLFMEQQLKGYEAQIIKGDTREILGGVVKAPQSLAYKYLALCTATATSCTRTSPEDTNLVSASLLDILPLARLSWRLDAHAEVMRCHSG